MFGGNIVPDEDPVRLRISDLEMMNVSSKGGTYAYS